MPDPTVSGPGHAYGRTRQIPGSRGPGPRAPTRPPEPMEFRIEGVWVAVKGRGGVIYWLDPPRRNRALPSCAHLISFLEIRFYSACPDCAIIQWAVSFILWRCRMGRRAQRPWAHEKRVLPRSGLSCGPDSGQSISPERQPATDQQRLRDTAGEARV